MNTTPTELSAIEKELAEIEQELSRRRIFTLDYWRAHVPQPFAPFFVPARYKGAYGGRGSGKSWSFGEMVLAHCMMHKGARIVCIREVQKSLEQSVKRLLEDLIQKHNLGAHFRVLNTHIETPGGGIIIFNGMQTHTAESIKSLEGYTVAWVEEAQSLSQRSLDLLRPTIREEGSELWFTWNPRYATDPIDVLLRAGEQPPDSVVVKSTYQDNPFFPEVLRKEMEWDRSRDPDKYAHIWLGEYERNSESRVFKNWTVEEFETPATTNFYFGGDWGYSIDPTVLVRCFVDGRKLFIDREAYKIGVEVDHLPAFFDTVPESRRWTIVADSARPETISYLQRHGYPLLEPAIKGKDSVKEGVIFLQSYDIVIHPRCIHTIDEFTMYSFKRDPLTDMVTPILEDKKNHVIDSVRYAVEKLRKGADWVTWGLFICSLNLSSFL